MQFNTSLAHDAVQYTVHIRVLLQYITQLETLIQCRYHQKR